MLEQDRKSIRCDKHLKNAFLLFLLTYSCQRVKRRRTDQPAAFLSANQSSSSFLTSPVDDPSSYLCLLKTLMNKNMCTTGFIAIDWSESSLSLVNSVSAKALIG